MEITNNIKYMVQLDGLRGLAILGVLPVHFLSKTDLGWLGFIDSGDLGVKLFFVLSGFLIGSTLLAAREKIENGTHSIRKTLVNFYIRRSLRLFPLYYLYLLLSFFLIPQVREFIFWFITYTQNILFFQEPWIFTSFLAHLWTLAIEEQFYLISPIIILITPKKLLPSVLLFMIFGALIFRMISQVYDTNTVWLLPAQMDVLSIGVLAAVFSTSVKFSSFLSSFKQLSLTLGLCITILCLVLKSINMFEYVIHIIWNTGLGLLFCWVILSASFGFKGLTKNLLEFKPLLFLGKISYGVYVLHFNVPGLLREIVFPRLGWQLFDSSIINFFMFTVVSILLATMSWYFFEKPILNLKNKFKL